MSLFNSLIPSFTRGSSGRDNGAEPANAIKPLYEVRETDEGYGLTVYLPGVAKDGVELTAEADELRIVGRRNWKKPEGWSALHRESADAPFALVLEHEHAINADQIHAELADGVLRVSLPKAEALKPRKIAVS